MSEPLKPCPFCGSENVTSDPYVNRAKCMSCWAFGPCGVDCGTGTRRWNAAPRPAPRPPGPTARVRIPVAVTDKGVWGAYSWGFRDGALGKQAGATAEESEEIAGPNGERKHVVWVTADVPLPPREVQGEVER